MFHLVLRLPLGVALVSRETFEDKEAAEKHWQGTYPDLTALEVCTAEDVAEIAQKNRVVEFPEKPTA